MYLKLMIDGLSSAPFSAFSNGKKTRANPGPEM